MPTKAVTNRQKDSQAIIAAGNTHAQMIALEVEACIKPHLKKGEKAPDFALVATALTRMLAGLHDAMVAADEAHERELGDDATPRNARDEAAARLGKLLVDLREILVGMFGAAKVKELGFGGTVPRDPVVLARYAGEIATAVRGSSMSKPRIKGAEWKPAAVADQIEALRDVLDAALVDVGRETREAQATLEAKNKAIVALDAACGGVAEVLGGLLRLSGKAELAEKLWPVARRAAAAPGTPEEEEPLEGGATPLP
jgi:hypothetical protein